MIRRAALNFAFPIRGGPRPWKKRDTIVAVHASQRPPEPAEVDFNGLGLKYEVSTSPEFVIPRTNWTPPPVQLPNLPFVVERTLVGASLPVYTDFKAGRTKVVTILRRCKGDIRLLKEEMEKVVGKEVLVKPGKLVVEGNFQTRLKTWLVGLGF